LGYGAAQVGGLLDQRISKVTERFFARANVVGGLRGLLAMWRGKTDYRVWQSRADTIQSMREAALDQGLHETMSALLKRYADELELINTRDMVERSRFVDDRQQEMARGQESVQTAQAARRRKKRLKRGNNPKRKLQRMVNRVRAGRVAEQKEEKETAS
jgi:hypothetical protein